MKVELAYRAPGTRLSAYTFHTYYDAAEVAEALEERKAAEAAGYEIIIWRLIHDEDVTY